MNSIGGALIVFGGIFLIMSVIIYHVMRKKVINPDCQDDVEGVKTNKKFWFIFFITSLFAVIAGILWILLIN